MSKRFLTPLGLHSSASDPSSASIGNVYFNTASNVLRLYFNSQWNSIHNITASYGLSTDYIDFSLSPISGASVGRLQWSDGEGTLTVGLKGGNINLDIGQEQVAYCYNGTGSAMPKGTVVYISGAQGQRPSITKASSLGESTSSKVLGMTAETINDGATGYVATFGIIQDIDTSAYAPGTALWLSSTPGEATSQKVYAPNHLVFIGYAIKQSSTAGQIFLSPQNGLEIYELHNVSASNPNNNDILFYNGSASLWEATQTQSLITTASVGFANRSASSTISSSATISTHAGTASSIAGSLVTGTVASATVSASSVISSLTSQTNFTTLTLSGSTVATQAWVQAQGYSTTPGGGSSASTGTGSVVYNTSPTMLGTISASNISMSGNLTASNGFSIFNSASAQNIVIRNSSSTTSTAPIQAILTSTSQPAFRFDGRSTDASTDNSNGIGFYLTHNEAGNRQFAIASTDDKLGVRFIGNTIDGWLNNNRTELYIGNNTAGVYLLSAGNSIPTRRFSISNYTGASTSIVSVIQGASFQTADLTRWIDVTGNTLAYIDASGNASFPSASISGSAVATQTWVESNYEPKLSFTYSTAPTTNTSTTNFVKPTGFKNALITANKFYEFEIVLLIDVSTNLAVSHLLEYATASFGSVAVISGTNTTQFSNIGSTDTLASSSAIIAVTTAINSGVTDAPTILKGFIVPSVSGSFGYGGFRVGAAGTASVMANSFIKVSEVTPT